jgi:hypothetical protein
MFQAQSSALISSEFSQVRARLLKIAQGRQTINL